MLKNVIETGPAAGVKVLLVDDLHPEDSAMFQALYSRSNRSAEDVVGELYVERRAALHKVLTDYRVPTAIRGCDPDAFLDGLEAVAGHADASKRGGSIMAKVYANWNHASVAEGGFTVLCAEGISLLAAKAIQDNPLYIGTEKSTRFLDMAAARTVDPINTPASRAVVARWDEAYAAALAPVADEVRRRYPRRDGEAEDAYEGAVRARAFDVCRCLLPAGKTTAVSWTTNLRQAGDNLRRLLHHPLAEVRDLAAAWRGLLRERYPHSGTFGGTAEMTGVTRSFGADEREAWTAKAWEAWSYPAGPGMLFDLIDEHDPPDTVRFHSTLNVAWIGADNLLRTRPRGAGLPPWMVHRGVVRAWFALDFGSFRDLQRHRHEPPMMPLLATTLGFEPWYLDQFPGTSNEGLRERVETLVREQTAAIEALDASPEDKQYLTALGFRVPTVVCFGLPAFVYVAEVRTQNTVHPTLRRAVLKHLVEPFRRRHPEIALHADDAPDPWDVRRGTQDIRDRATGKRVEL